MAPEPTGHDAIRHTLKTLPSVLKWRSTARPWMGLTMRTQAAQSVDFDSLERALSVRRRARADGQAERPPSNSEEETPCERDIRAAIAAETDRIAAAERTLSAELMRRFGQRPGAGDGVDAALAGARLALRLAEARIGDTVREARDRAARAKADLVGFRARQGLDRDADYPDSRVLAIGLLLAAALFEAIFSATLFVHDADGGYAQAAAVALGLGGSNVLLGVLAGYVGMRQLQRREPVLKLTGAAALAVFAGLGLALNVFAARYRESLAAGEETGRPLLQLSRSELFGLITPEAVVLLMLGVGVWMFSAGKGFAGLDDPFPGYGGRDRFAKAAAEDYEALRIDAIDALERPIRDADDAIEADVAEHRAHVQALQAAYDAAGASAMALAAQRRALASAQRDIVALYQRENMLARTTPAPARFGETNWPDPSAIDPLAEAGAALRDANATMKTLRDRASAAHAALQSHLQDSQRRLFGEAP